MPSYADIIAGRLLLLRAQLPPPVLWAALQDLARPGEGAPLRELAWRRGLIDAGQLADFVRHEESVLRAEQERTLARLLHLEGLASREALEEALNASREQGYALPLGPWLVERGQLEAGRLEPLIPRARAALAAARQRRVESLAAFLRGLPSAPGPAAVRELDQAFRLCEVALELSVGAQAGGTPGGVAPGRADPARPEDCPIYGYALEGVLGEGAMGVVYRARHIQSGRPTALKVLPLRLAAEGPFLERFKREAMALMRLRHPHVVAAYDFGGSEEHYYLALELVEGETLDRVLKRAGPLPQAQALEVARQVAAGLGAAEACGVVHRDVKPDNILWTPEGVAKLCDFGIVKLTDLDDGGITRAGTTVGTPFYIAPEQARGEEADTRSDLYALGVTLYHLGTGQVPFAGPSQGAILVKHILEEVPDPRGVRPELGASFAEAVRALTRKRREERPPTAAAAEALLERALAELGRS